MKPFKRILVALDISAMDHSVIDYAFWFAKSVEAEKVYFLYCARELREFKAYPFLKGEDLPRDEAIREEITKMVRSNKLSKKISYEILVDQMAPLEGLLYWKDVKKIDLLIVGKKKYTSGSGIISRQFVRQSDCSVLFVPEDVEPAIKKILVPVDFSKNSSYALELGVQLQPHFGNPEIICLNVFFTSPDIYGAQEAEMYNKLRQAAVDEEYQEFIAPFLKDGQKITPLFKPDSEFRTKEKILAAAAEQQADLIIIGAIGHSKVKLLTVGSTAEKMMLSDFSAPLLVIRE